MSASEGSGRVLAWRKAKLSTTNGECVEVATNDERVLIRDSRTPGGVVLHCSPVTYRSFIGAIKNGRYTLARLYLGSVIPWLGRS